MTLTSTKFLIETEETPVYQIIYLLHSWWTNQTYQAEMVSSHQSILYNICTSEIFSHFWFQVEENLPPYVVLLALAPGQAPVFVLDVTSIYAQVAQSHMLPCFPFDWHDMTLYYHTKLKLKFSSQSGPGENTVSSTLQLWSTWLTTKYQLKVHAA